METETNDKHNRPSFFERNAALIKGFFIGILILLLLIPTFMVQEIVREREMRKEAVVKEVSSKWANKQTIVGPILRVPYYDIEKVEKMGAGGKKEIEQTKKLSYAYFLPEKLNISSTVTPNTRNRGIYEVVVYQSKMKLNGHFSDISLKNTTILPEDILWKDATILLTVSDFRGIDEEVIMNWNAQKIAFNTGEKLPIESNESAVRSSLFVPVSVENQGKGINKFSFDLSLKGSEAIDFIPVGKTTEIQMQSSWKNPSFDGSFLPDQRTVDKNGFKASWKVLHLNRDFPQQWENVAPIALEGSAVSVKLITPNDNYQKSSRSIKYAIMIIALTFMTIFFIEVLNQKRIHPLNYILIGIGLCIFYTLLISISEFLGFNQAYMIACTMTIGLIFLYSKSIMGTFRLAFVVSAILLLLYFFVFVVIQLEDTALLIGSIGLFLILAITMYVSRKIDWGTVGLRK